MNWFLKTPCSFTREWIRAWLGGKIRLVASIEVQSMYVGRSAGALHGTRSHFQLAAYRGSRNTERKRDVERRKNRRRALPAARAREMLSTGSGNFLEMTNGRLRGTSIPVLPQIVDLGRVPRRPLNHRDRQFTRCGVLVIATRGFTIERFWGALTRDRGVVLTF